MTPAQKKRPKKKSKTIYIIEDDEDLVTLMGEGLRLEGYSTRVCVSDFEDILTSEQWTGVDVLLLDLWLTNDGVSQHFPMAMKILRYVSQFHPSVRRIVYTAFDERIVEKIVEQSIREISDAFFTKPVPLRILIQEIERKR